MFEKIFFFISRAFNLHLMYEMDQVKFVEDTL